MTSKMEAGEAETMTSTARSFVASPGGLGFKNVDNAFQSHIELRDFTNRCQMTGEVGNTMYHKPNDGCTSKRET